MKRLFSVLSLAAGLAVASSAYAGARLLATGGVTQVEGSGGGGLVPWALISGLGTDRQIGGTASCTQVEPQEFTLRSCGVTVGLYDRVELSFARQRLDVDSVIPGETLSQNIFGVKVRLYGDAVYDQDRWQPQLALGVQYKKNRDHEALLAAIGAERDDDYDVYLAATKVYLAGPFSRTWLVNATLRATRANQLGLLGFGGDRGSSRSLEGEGSVAVFLTDAVVLGAEYRQKPDKLSAFEEEDFWDAFVAWFPAKNVSVTGAYANLGNIATHDDQRGWYLSLQGAF